MADITGRYNTYVGMRYVPVFAGAWDATADYEPLTIVTSQGNSYTSRTYVPAGTPVTNNTYWALTGNYNAQIEQYRQQVQEIQDTIDETVEYVQAAYLTPELFGAVGDGAADDTAAFRQMIDAARYSGQGIIIPEKSYKLTQPFYVSDHLMISNAGTFPQKTLIVPNPVADSVFNETESMNVLNARGLGVASLNVQGGCYNDTLDRCVQLILDGSNVYAAQFDAEMKTYYSKTQIATDSGIFHAGDICWSTTRQRYYIASGNTNVRVFDSNFNFVGSITFSESVYGIDFDEANDCLVIYRVNESTQAWSIALCDYTGEVLDTFPATFNRPNDETYTSYQQMFYKEGTIFATASVFTEGYNNSNFAVYKLNTEIGVFEPAFIANIPLVGCECENAFFTPAGLYITGATNSQIVTVRLSNELGEYIAQGSHILYVDETANSSGNGSSAAQAINDLDFAFIVAKEYGRDIRNIHLVNTGRTAAYTVQRFNGEINIDCDTVFPWIFRFSNVKINYNNHNLTIPANERFNATASIIAMLNASITLNNTIGIGVGDGSYWNLRGLTIAAASSADNLLCQAYEEGTINAAGCRSSVTNYIGKTYYGGAIFNTYNNAANTKAFEHRTPSATTEGVIVPAP